jgi:hypothetical protein
MEVEVLQESTREWYAEIVRLGQLVAAWDGDPSRDMPSPEILDSMRRLGIIKKIKPVG